MKNINVWRGLGGVFGQDNKTISKFQQYLSSPNEFFKFALLSTPHALIMPLISMA